MQVNKSSQRRGFLQALSLLVVSFILIVMLAACNGATVTVVPTSATTALASAGATTINVATVGSGNNQAGFQQAAAAAPTGAVNTSQAQAAPVSADQQESQTVIGVVQKINPAVVTVYNKVAHPATTGNNLFPGQPNRNRNGTPTPIPDSSGNGNGNGITNSPITQGIGSGVIFDSKGYIVTNAHVVDGAQEVDVAYNDGKQLVKATIVGVDKTGDIAVLKVEGALPAVASFGDSSKLQVGQTVVAIGAALGNFRNSVSKGVVSGLSRTINEIGGSDVYIQTDTAINHGNSGGPLLDLNGNIIGINTAVLRTTPGIGSGSDAVAEGLGFAIPSNTVKYITDQLISNGKVVRPYFGIRYQMITPALAGTLIQNGQTVPQAEGAWISNGSGSNQPGVEAGGPADKAGLKENDVITAIDGTTLNDNHPLTSVLENYKPGDTVKLTVQRGSQTLTLTLTLATRPDITN